MIDHCIAAFRAESKEKLYKAYITDALKAIVENTSKFGIPGVGIVDGGVKLTERWYDLMERKPQKKEEQPQEDTRSASEIASDMWARIRGHST